MGEAKRRGTLEQRKANPKGDSWRQSAPSKLSRVFALFSPNAKGQYFRGRFSTRDKREYTFDGVSVRRVQR